MGEAAFCVSRVDRGGERIDHFPEATLAFAQFFLARLQLRVQSFRGLARLKCIFHKIERGPSCIFNLYVSRFEFTELFG